MSRQAFAEAITYADEASGNLKIANSGEVSVFNAGTETLAKLYEARTGGALLGNPFILGSTAMAYFWADSGDYDIKVHDTKGPARFGDFIFGWQSSPANQSIGKGDLSNNGDIEWTQELSGAWVPQLKTNVVTANEIANGVITEANLITALKERTGITANRAGAKIISTEQEKNFGGVFGTMTTPDEVSGVVVGEKDLLFVSYQALWDGGPTGNPNKAAIFVGSNQIKNPVNGGAPAVQSIETIASTKQWLSTTGFGLTATASGAVTGEVTTGLTMAVANGSSPFCILQVGAGTYNVAIKFNGNSARAKERRLYVWTAQFS